MPMSPRYNQNQHKIGSIIPDKIESVECSKFAPIMVIAGNNIELWELNDIEFEKTRYEEWRHNNKKI